MLRYGNNTRRPASGHCNPGARGISYKNNRYNNTEGYQCTYRTLLYSIIVLLLVLLVFYMIVCSLPSTPLLKGRCLNTAITLSYSPIS